MISSVRTWKVNKHECSILFGTGAVITTFVDISRVYTQNVQLDVVVVSSDSRIRRLSASRGLQKMQAVEIWYGYSDQKFKFKIDPFHLDILRLFLFSFHSDEGECPNK